ncbi:MAG: hypothetical protein IK123_05645 [Lachnospiraceae bacterium]|nr:hypothetical protein [Lachnospiraceae bacterium]
MTNGSDNNNVSAQEIDDIVNMLDGFIDKNVSRFKITTSEEMEEGEIKEVYHHGRCDVGSPWAKGCSFDVLE